MKAEFTHYLSSIEPNTTAPIKMLKYRSAMAWRIASALKRRVYGTNNKSDDEVSSEEQLNQLLKSEYELPRVEGFSKPKIMLLGPYHYKQPMWSVRAKAALPDIISPLSQISEVHWVTPIPTHEILPSIYEISAKNNFHHHLLPPSYNLKSLTQQAQVLDKLISKIRPQLMMNNFGVIASGFDAVSSAKRHNILSVLRVPGDELNAKRKMQKGMIESKSGLEISKANFAIKNADHVMVMSDSEQSRISKDYQRDQNIFVQIRGVDTSVFKPHENRDGHSRIFNIGFAGRLSLEKGTDILFGTVERLRDHPNIHIHIASPEKLEAELLEKYHNLKWRGYIRHEEMSAFMKEMDALILPSHMEGRSQTMMEAMSCGLPVLMQKHIHPEKLPGMIHCSANAETFTKEIIQLESDRAYLLQISNQARQSAIKYFDKTNWSKTMAEKFKNLLRSA